MNMKSQNIKRDMLIATVIAVVLLLLFAAASRMPLMRYDGPWVCDSEERYTVLSGGYQTYIDRVDELKAYGKRVDPDGDGSGVGPAVGCPEGGYIELYLL